MNIESNISNVNKLIEFLKYLNKKIKEVNQDAIIVWYDSIIIPDGVVKW